MKAGALAGRTVLVTRAAEGAELWARGLEELGARPLVLPCLVCEPVTDAGTAELLHGKLVPADWLVVQSRRGAESAAWLIAGLLPARVKVAAIGPQTAQASRMHLGRVDLVAGTPTAAELARTVTARLATSDVDRPVRVVIAAAAGGRDEVARALSAAGVDVTRICVYRTVPVPATGPKYDLAAAGVDDILLASPSAVTGLLNRALPAPAARIFTIGPTTSAAAREAGLTVAAEARQPDLEGIVEAMS